MSLSNYLKGDYENIPHHGSRKKQSQLANLRPEIRSTKLEIQNIPKGQFEKTKPIYRRVNQLKLLIERRL
jgi:hypothetical protein